MTAKERAKDVWRQIVEDEAYSRKYVVLRLVEEAIHAAVREALDSRNQQAYEAMRAQEREGGK